MTGPHSQIVNFATTNSHAMHSSSYNLTENVCIMETTKEIMFCFREGGGAYDLMTSTVLGQNNSECLQCQAPTLNCVKYLRSFEITNVASFDVCKFWIAFVFLCFINFLPQERKVLPHRKQFKRGHKLPCLPSSTTEKLQVSLNSQPLFGSYNWQWRRPRPWPQHHTTPRHSDVHRIYSNGTEPIQRSIRSTLTSQTATRCQTHVTNFKIHSSKKVFL